MAIQGSTLESGEDLVNNRNESLLWLAIASGVLMAAVVCVGAKGTIRRYREGEKEVVLVTKSNCVSIRQDSLHNDSQTHGTVRQETSNTFTVYYRSQTDNKYP
jgi:hypothetical protein